MISDISVFFPIYNEEKNINETVTKAVEVLKKHFRNWEIVLVNDGSVDGTGAQIRLLRSVSSNIRIIQHQFNRGYGAAFRSGVYACRFDWIAFTDSDGQFDFSEILKFVEVQASTGADLIAGFYIKRSVSARRRLNTFLWHLMVKFLFKLPVRDIDCGFKLFSKKIIETIPTLESERGAFVSTEFLVKSQKCGFKIAEVGVHHYPRLSGSGTGANIEVIVKSFMDLFKLWRKIK